MKTLKTLLLVIFSTLFYLTGCNTNDGGVREKSREKIIQDSISQAKQDSVKKAEEARIAYEKRPWKSGEFVDNFGDPTGKKYIQTVITGSFSNSATTNEYLFVKLLITKSNAGLFLHEYSADRQAEKFIGDGTIHLKNETGEKIKIGIDGDWNQQGGLLIASTNFSKFMSFLKKSSGKIDVIVFDEYSSKFLFKIDLQGFNEEYTLLNK